MLATKEDVIEPRYRTDYDQSGQHLAEADSNGNYTAIYIWGPANLCLAKINIATDGKDTKETVTYFGNDYRADNILETDSNGKTLAYNQYTPWGEPTSIYLSGGYTANYRYTGKPYEPDTHTYNLGARVYYPELKRFITDDASNPELADFKSYNLYAAMGNDPVDKVDLDGRVGTDINDIDPFKPNPDIGVYPRLKKWMEYGNYGGPALTGGNVVPWAPPKDSLDMLYMRHDERLMRNPEPINELWSDIELVKNLLILPINTNRWAFKPENNVHAQAHRLAGILAFSLWQIPIVRVPNVAKSEVAELYFTFKGWGNFFDLGKYLSGETSTSSFWNR